MTHTKLIELTFPEVAQLIYDQRNMVTDQEQIIKDLDLQDVWELERFIVSLNRVPA